jgi:hypothetical protein
MLTKNSYANHISLNNPILELSTKNTMEIYTRLLVEVENGEDKDANVPVEEILNKIKLNLRKNNKTALVEVDAFKLCLLNQFDSGSYFNADGTVKVPKGGVAQIEVPLCIEGPFSASQYDDFDISLNVNQTVGTNLSIKSVDGVITTVNTDTDFSDEIIERTANVFKKSFDAISYQEVLKIQSTNAMQEAIVIIRGKNGKRTDDIIKNIGLRGIGNTKIDLYMVDYLSAKMMNRMNCNNKFQPKGALYINFCDEITQDVWGIKGWRLLNEKLYFALESLGEGSIEVLTKELVVNSELIDNAVFESM